MEKEFVPLEPTLVQIIVKLKNPYKQSHLTVPEFLPENVFQTERGTTTS